MRQPRTLSALFSFTGVRARSRLQGIFSDFHARLVTFERRKKRLRPPAVGRVTGPSTTARSVGCWIPRCGGVARIDLAVEQRRVSYSRCQRVEGGASGLAGAESALYTPVCPAGGTMCRKAVAQMLHLHDHTIKDLDTQYMQACWPKRCIRRRRSSGWMSCRSRSATRIELLGATWNEDAHLGRGWAEADLDRFFLDLGPTKTARIRLAVMDMWKACRNSVQTHAPRAQILLTWHRGVL